MESFPSLTFLQGEGGPGVPLPEEAGKNVWEAKTMHANFANQMSNSGWKLSLIDFYPAIEHVFMHKSVIAYRNVYNNSNRKAYTRLLSKFSFK